MHFPRPKAHSIAVDPLSDAVLHVLEASLSGQGGGLRLDRSTPGDGNCLYHSVLRSVSRGDQRHLVHGMTAQTLRLDSFQACPPDDEGLRLAAVDQGITPAAYVAQMAKDGEYVGMFELVLICRYLRIIVTVVTPNNVRHYGIDADGRLVEGDGHNFNSACIVAYNGYNHFFGTRPL